MSNLSEILFSLDDIGGWREEFLKNKEKIDRVLNNVESRGDTFYPFPQDVFNCFRLTPLENVKVIIWGQDPYPTLLGNGKTRAQGYAFGVAKEDHVPKSLVNIYKEIKDNYNCFSIPDHGDLTHVCRQGVLFMNSALTFNPDGDPKKSHINIWTRFTKIVIDIINRRVENCIHVLWGKQCEKLSDSIASGNILVSSHPSPLGAWRGFLGCKHFIQINIILDRQGKEQINWNIDPKLPPTFMEKIKKKDKNAEEATDCEQEKLD